MFTSLYGIAPTVAIVNRYPDRRLMEAAMLLDEAERPTVPVRLFNDSRQFYKTDHMRHLRAQEPPMGLVQDDKRYIYVNAKRAMKDPNILASVMAHEQRHIKGDDEPHARQKESDVLNRLNPKKYSGYIETLKSLYGVK